jgi:Ca-activated chloride channel family protein
MYMPKLVIMLRSRKALAALVFSFAFVISGVGQAPAQNAAPVPQPGSTQAAAPSGQGGQIPVQDLTPPSDYELEKLAAEAQKRQDEEQTALAANAKNQPGPNVNVPSQPKSKDQGGYLFKSQVEEVMLYATVVDPKNRIVTGLDRNSFTVYEDNVPQQITSFRREDIPVSLGILIDNSGSMRTKRPAVNAAALNLVRASNPQDEVFVVNFTDSDHIYRDQDFTSDVNLLKEALEKIESRGTTAIYDTVVASADYLEKGAKHDKKILLVVTDGEDNSSVKTLEQAVNAVQKENGPTVYTIGVLDKGDRGAKRARRALERLSLETGGIAFFPSDINEVDQISREIARDIRSQYAIGYKPVRPQSEGGFRSVRVEARGGGKDRLIVRTKSGYYAGQRQQASRSSSSGK